jgi:hypothetical protein
MRKTLTKKQKRERLDRPNDALMDMIAERGQPVKLEPDELTLRIVRALGHIQCTHGEVASVLGCRRATFTDWLNNNPEIREIWDAAQEGGRMSLRRVQFELALAGNYVMMIWLGKQYLGQRDKAETTVEVKESDSLAELREKLNSIKTRVVAQDRPPMLSGPTTNGGDKARP